jgi:ribosomal protein S18 acetylase RimI-like enzyme
MKDAKGHGSDSRGAHASGVENVGKYTVANDVRDSHGGELYGSVYATHALTGQHVGAIDYGARWKDGKREVSIQMIKVLEEHQHQGVASQMLDKLQSEFPDDKGHAPTIHWGGTTPEGTALRKAYYRARAKK